MPLNMMHFIICLAILSPVFSLPTYQVPLLKNLFDKPNGTVTRELFAELEELSRIVDISYCVDGLGIAEPFQCASRCTDFPNFELVTTWSTGHLLSDSVGYIALAHSPSAPRIIVAFRGSYSITNAIIDLSTVPQEFTPYPDKGSGNGTETIQSDECTNCTVHMGFYTAWKNTRSEILPHLAKAVEEHPNYRVTLVGHSLGGAVAALASLEFRARGWNPQVTTFGEPRVGNKAFVKHLDSKMGLSNLGLSSNYRRLTHINDPIPLLPLTEWGYRPHGGEIYISKPALPPSDEDLLLCTGDEDQNCSAGADESLGPADKFKDELAPGTLFQADALHLGIPARFKLVELFFAHRDYFWRLGVCLPGGDPMQPRNFQHLINDYNVEL